MMRDAFIYAVILLAVYIAFVLLGYDHHKALSQWTASAGGAITFAYMHRKTKESWFRR